MKVYRAVCGCGFDREYSTEAYAERGLHRHRCADYRTTHRRSCRACGWSGVYRSAAKANASKRAHSCQKWTGRAAAKARGDARKAAVDRTPKPCLHKQADHQHGTRTAYVLDRCRCLPCSRANAAAESDRERQKAYGRYDWFVSAAQARAHVLHLMDQGMGLKRIVAVSGVAQGTLWKLVYGKRQADGVQKPTRRITHHVHDRLMATRLNLADGARVDSTGTHRRVQALVAIGWSQQKIANRLGMNRGNFGTMMSRTTVTRRTRDTMVAIFDEWSMRLPPATNQRERGSASRARNHAKAHGWVPPLAWDDDAIDDPNARPSTHVDDEPGFDEAAILRRMSGDRVRVTKTEKAEVIRRLRAEGVSDTEITKRTGLYVTRYVPAQRDLPTQEGTNAA